MCGIFPDQGLKPCPLHWQVDSDCATREVPEPVFLMTVMSSLLGVRALWGPSEIGRDHVIGCEVLLPRTQKFLFGFLLFE